MAVLTPKSQADFLLGAELGGQIPAVMGQMAQNFNSNFGFHGSIYVNPFIAKEVDHYIYVGYQSLTLKSDPNTSFRMIPILFGLGISGKTFSESLYADFGLGVGGTIDWVNVPNISTFRMGGHFLVQLQPGISITLADEFDLYFRTPVYFLIGQKQLNYMAYDFGLKMRF